MGSVTIHKSGRRPLGETELVAIAVGGMIGGGIFSVLGVAAGRVGYHALYSLAIGGLLALLSVYSYAKLTQYYKDEGATYSFFKRTFPGSAAAASMIGWIVSFGYISTLALYASTFGSYAAKALGWPDGHARWAATALLALFTIVNIVSVRGMGVLEDLLVYAKLLGIVIISILFVSHGRYAIAPSLKLVGGVNFWGIVGTAALTYVAYEGFQLAINAYRDVNKPSLTVPRAMYKAVAIVTAVYLLLAFGAFRALPLGSIIQGQEFALAAGARQAVGMTGYIVIIAAALFATTSALSGTLYGASRIVAVIAGDGYMPRSLARRSAHGIPILSVLAMALIALLLVWSGSLEKVLEFGSITFMASSLLVAVAAYKVRRQARASSLILVSSIIGLLAGIVLLVAYQVTQETTTISYTFGLYAIIGLLAAYYARRNTNRKEHV